MAAHVIDQTDSEVKLHRLLYFIKYLRGLLLNAFVSLIAILLYVAFGIAGAYVLATDTINALKAQMMSATAQGMSGSQFIVQLVLTSLFIVAFFVWSYLSIVNVSKISLRIQAIFLMISVLSGPLWAGPQIRFAMAKLNPGFVALVFLGIVVGLYMIGDVTCAMWRTSRATENSSFKATLDPRLARGTWSYINKLLDLPRTPWRNWRNRGVLFPGLRRRAAAHRLRDVHLQCRDHLEPAGATLCPVRRRDVGALSGSGRAVDLTDSGVARPVVCRTSRGGLYAVLGQAPRGLDRSRSTAWIKPLHSLSSTLTCFAFQAERGRKSIGSRRRYLRARAGIAWPAFSNRSRVSLR
jgi:hypothetical protein